MRIFRLYQIDSFTKNKFSGNPAGVITNADGLTENEMKKIARELNNSETAFVFSSTDHTYDVHVRFFTPTVEVPICGHATIAAHYARAVEQQLDTTRVRQKTGAGILPVDVIREENDYKVVMRQGKIEFGSVIEGENRDFLLDALHITDQDLLANCPIQVVSTGHSKVMIGIKNSILLHQLNPKFEALTQLSKRLACNGYYVFTMDSAEEDILVKGRMFAPAIGINEDPVTGNANGPLGAYLVHHKLVKHDGSSFRFKAKQGEAMERTGTIEVEVQLEKGEPFEVSVSGKAVIVFQSELIL
ncbi:PhzF family isomerase [Bacillus horti]|uniref:PhzF family phenazine biosynthesis protein n=1 Tax=Caldalkalibacillus horti TaxID=77523 RepID=A0ABT9W598_9BACI|nr:PhzF family isomerase [Bacillus horti]MDQ0168427.1 PhzF family phenazine biosynthesis protein [Bacillus horti]